MGEEPEIDEVDLSATAETSQERIGDVLRKGLRRHTGMETCPASGVLLNCQDREDVDPPEAVSFAHARSRC